MGLDYLEQVNQRIRNIGTADLEALIASEPSPVLIDIRHESEVNARGGMIDGHREIIVPRGWLEFRMPNEVPEKDTPIVVYCGINQRSPLAAETLGKMGYTDVRNYAPGFFEWRDLGKPVKFTDRALDSILFRKPEEVADNVWSAIGATAPGSYAVTYNVSDAAGNAAPQQVRTVVVADTLAPVITLNGADPQLVEAGNPYVEAGATADALEEAGRS